MASALSILPWRLSASSSSSNRHLLSSLCSSFISPITLPTTSSFHTYNNAQAVQSIGVSIKSKSSSSSILSHRRNPNFICRAAEYKFPDPIPEFAEAETEKFRSHLISKLSKKDIFGDSVEEVVAICTEILSTFLHTEYGGPGTLLVVPFIDMADTLNEKGLPGGPQAARAAVKWAQAHIDKDWKEWNSNATKPKIVSV